MTSSRKQPGVAFWATVMVVAVAGYLLSWGPVFWALSATGNPAWPTEAYRWIYGPLIWVDEQCPQSIQDATMWYLNIVPLRQ